MSTEKFVPDSLSESEIIRLDLVFSSGGLEDSIALVSGLFFKSKDLGGRLDHLDSVGPLGLLIFNIGIQGLQLSSHVLGRLGPHSHVGVVADDVLSLGGGDRITKVLKKTDNLLASGWRHGIHPTREVSALMSGR